MDWPPLSNTARAETLAGWRSLGTRHYLFRHSLVAAQICVSLVLLTGASLLLRSLWNLQNQPLGMRTGSVLTATVTLGRKSYAEPASQLAFFEELERRLHRYLASHNWPLSDSLPPERARTIHDLFRHRRRGPPARGAKAPAAW